MRTGTPVGYEALSRFTDVHGGALRPDLVFAEAPRLGLGVRLEQAALAAALDFLPLIPVPRYLSVNLSPAALADPATHDLLTTVPAGRILLEITEHEAVPDYPTLTHLLDHQRSRGMRIAVDDAGAGYASLQHLTRLRPDVIKLDISLVRGIDTDSACRAMARSIIAYAQETGAILVAEGIETHAERHELAALGARLGLPQPVNNLSPSPDRPHDAPDRRSLHAGTGTQTRPGRSAHLPGRPRSVRSQARSAKRGRGRAGRG